MSNNNLRRIYIYSDSDLPKEGWIQGCFMCGIYVSSYYHEETKTYTNKKFKICSYLCEECHNLTVTNKDFELLYLDNYYKKIDDLFNKFIK